LTPLERQVLRIVADRVAADLDGAWGDHVDLGLSLNRFESMPEMLRVANREDPMLVATLRVRCAGSESELRIGVPFAVLEKFFSGPSGQRERSGQAESPARRVERAQVEQAVRATGIEASARLTGSRIALGDLALLRADMTLLTGLAPDTAVSVALNGTDRFLGVAGRSGRNLAIRITQAIDTDAASAEPADHTQSRMVNIMDSNTARGVDAAVDLDELGRGAGAANAANLASLFQLTLPVTIELCRTRLTVQEVLELGRGSVIQLERLVGEPVDVIVGDRRFAEGEVVVIGEQFGVRITRVVSGQPESGAA
jgi:flagellar motor switch protein FliN